MPMPMPMPLTFYTNPMSRSRIVRWMLEETGAAYEPVVLEYGPPMKSPEYLAINPMGKVPAIKHGDTVITETPAICAYLADAFPEAGLAPPVNQRGSYYRWLFFAAGPIETAVLIHALNIEVTPEKQRMAGFGNHPLMLDTLEKLLSGCDFVANNTFSAADVYLGSEIGWGMQFGTLEKRPALEDYYQRLSSRPAWQRANALDMALVPES